MGCISLNGVFVPAQLREEGQAVVSGGNHCWEVWALSCHFSTLLWTRDKKSFMGCCGENWWKPALFYFWNIFLVELILRKKIVSGLCVYIGPSSCCSVPSSPSRQGSEARPALRPGFSPQWPLNLSKFTQRSHSSLCMEMDLSAPGFWQENTSFIWKSV